MANNSSGSSVGSAAAAGGVASMSGVAGSLNNSSNSDLWRECVDWLTRCQIIQPDHMANAPTSEIRVLALTLRDGVLLCNLVMHLDPTCMDASQMNRRPQMAQVSWMFKILIIYFRNFIYSLILKLNFLIIL